MMAEEFIKMIGDINEILHEYGFIVDHDILAHHILDTIRESNPNENITIDKNQQIYKVIRFKPQSEIDKLFK